MSEFEYKQVIVFRSDLKLSKGKIAAQAAQELVGGVAVRGTAENRGQSEG